MTSWAHRTWCPHCRCTFTLESCTRCGHAYDWMFTPHKRCGCYASTNPAWWKQNKHLFGKKACTP